MAPVFEIFDDRFTITSYGGLPQEITQEDFFNAVSAPRNKELMRVFKDVDLVEQLGSGMERIMSVYDRSIFEFLPNFLRINFYFDKKVLEYLEQDEQKTNKKTTINSKKKPQEKDILNYCKEPRSLKEICYKFGFKDTRTFKKNYLNNLIENGTIEMTIPNKPKNRNQKYINKMK